MNRFILILLGIFLPLLSFAADIPQVVIGAEKYDKAMCIERAANDCINTICLTSSARDCTDKCRASAEDKCQNASE